MIVIGASHLQPSRCADRTRDPRSQRPGQGRSRRADRPPEQGAVSGHPGAVLHELRKEHRHVPAARSRARSSRRASGSSCGSARGPVIDKVENYVGMTLDEVKIHLQTLFATHSPNSSSGSPCSTGTRAGSRRDRSLRRAPRREPRSPGLTYLELVVSQDQGGETTVSVGDYVGKSFQEAISELTQVGHPLCFHCEENRGGQGGREASSTRIPDQGRRSVLGRLSSSPWPLRAMSGRTTCSACSNIPYLKQPIAVDISLDIVSGLGPKERAQHETSRRSDRSALHRSRRQRARPERPRPGGGAPEGGPTRVLSAAGCKAGCKP